MKSYLRLCFTLAGLVFSAAVAAFAQTPSSATSLIENSVYQTNCAKYHGKTAEGRHFAGPSLVSEKTTGAPADELRDIITNGKHRMPKFVNKLTPEEINTLVEEIKAQNKN
jgi:mono/diheme cytochrome c family protein